MQHEEFTLSELESKHCIKVLRKIIGDRIELVNGLGGQFECKITDDHFKKCTVKIINRIQHQPKKQELHIAMAIPKSSERLEWFLEKATELGLTKLSLINCTNSERKTLNEKRLEKIAISALKQSKRFYLPKIEGPIPFLKFIQNEPKGYIGHCYETNKKHAKTISQAAPILIGPEGDFSREEVEEAKESGYTEIELSENRLRTETAALCAVFYLTNV
tara:strand:- start:294 stop:947 length:654 start_codon:yes stop_codon:yes gene_type:complete